MQRPWGQVPEVLLEQQGKAGEEVSGEVGDSGATWPWGRKGHQKALSLWGGCHWEILRRKGLPCDLRLKDIFKIWLLLQSKLQGTCDKKQL